MKLLLFKSKTCGPCKLFEPQIKIASLNLKIDYIPVFVDENETFNLFNQKISTLNLIKRFDINSSGKLLFIYDETDESSPMVMFERPCRSDEIEKTVNNLIKSIKEN